MNKRLAFRKNVLGSCTGRSASRNIAYQVPSGQPPAAGWPVVFYYNGTQPTPPIPAEGPTTIGPFDPAADPYGGRHLLRAMHELLDDPAGTGRKYAIVFPDPPAGLFGSSYWDTNALQPYRSTGDACFLPTMFKALSDGQFIPGVPLDMTRRFAIGISSGGYNASRMAVSFNEDNSWKALAIQSASYATCFGPLCFPPSNMPSNHPPTKFWHGTDDKIVPIRTMYAYNDRLTRRGYRTALQVNGLAHEFGPDVYGSTGFKAWFDQF